MARTSETQTDRKTERCIDFWTREVKRAGGVDEAICAVRRRRRKLRLRPLDLSALSEIRRRVSDTSQPRPARPARRRQPSAPVLPPAVDLPLAG